jgi:XTP/dITP diphosphohydrolase
MYQLLIATSNEHKTAEIRAMLGSAWEVSDLRGHPGLVLPEETGDTFEANAIIKAEGASAALPGLLVLSDDSGLEVDALGGAPGVRSARYAGEAATDSDNRARLKRELSRIIAPAEGFRGRFRCCMALARGGRAVRTFSGAVEGRLILAEQGEGGFGYDPLFIPDTFDQTFGQLPAEVKNQLSHRSRALAQVIAWLASQREVTP